MPNKNYQRGRRWEYNVAKTLRENGYHVLRTAGSKGKWDLIALDEAAGHIVLIQCKVAATEAAKNRLAKGKWFDEIKDGNISSFINTLHPWGDNVVEMLMIKVSK